MSEQELFESELEYTTSYNVRFSREAREIINLMPYAPHTFIEHILSQLQKYKTLHSESIKNI